MWGSRSNLLQLSRHIFPYTFFGFLVSSGTLPAERTSSARGAWVVVRRNTHSYSHSIRVSNLRPHPLFPTGTSLLHSPRVVGEASITKCNLGLREKTRRMMEVFHRFDKYCSCHHQGECILMAKEANHVPPSA